MAKPEFDLVVIGGGSGGLVVAAGGAALGAKVALVEKHKGRPFAMLSVCTDPELETGRKTAEERGIKWPCWFDGQNGPIARAYNVLSWPTMYVLDKEGKIAAKNPDGKELEAKIAELLSGK